MELKDFISQAIKDLLHGVLEAQNDAKTGNCVVPSGKQSNDLFPKGNVVHNGDWTSTLVNFDIAISAEESAAKGGKAGVKIAVLSAALDTENTNKNTSTSRIQFSVPVILPKNTKNWDEVTKDA